MPGVDVGLGVPPGPIVPPAGVLDVPVVLPVVELAVDPVPVGALVVEVVPGLAPLGAV